MAIKLKNYFPGYIGQAHIVGAFNEALTLEALGKVIPLGAEFLAGPAGLGKTHLAELFAKARAEIHGPDHRFLSFNAATLTSGHFIAQLIEHCVGRPVTIFIDEVGSLTPKMRNMLKTLIETGGEVKDITLAENVVFPSNPFQHKYFLASNEDVTAKDPALFGSTGRCITRHFEPYSPAEKKALIRYGMARGAEVTKIDADAVDFLERRCFPNAREIVGDTGVTTELRKKAMFAPGGKISLAFAKSYCAGELSHLPADRIHEGGRYLLGLKWADVMLLEYLNGEVSGRQVQDIAVHIGLPKKDAGDKLVLLAGADLVQTLNNGRKALTKNGATYLATLRALKTKSEAARKGKAAANLPPVEAAAAH